MKKQFTIKHEVNYRHYISAIIKLLDGGISLNKKTIEQEIYNQLKWSGDVEYWYIPDVDECVYIKAQETFNKIYK